MFATVPQEVRSRFVR